MKSKNIMMVAVLLMLLPPVATAQKNIRQAFEALVSHAGSEMSNKSSLTRDPETNRKTGQYDVYDFKLPKKDKTYITAIETAFQKDREAAYDVVAGTSDGRSYTYTSLAVGDGSGAGVAIGKTPKSRYIYALFMDKDDPEKKYRYAYALEWKEESSSITGRIVTTYATTLKYRQQQKKNDGKTSFFSSLKGLSFDGKKLVIGNDGNRIVIDNVNDSTEVDHINDGIDWLGEFVMYKDLCAGKLEQESASASMPAAELYKLCRDKRAKYLSDNDRAVVIAELEKLKRKTEDNIIRTMLQRAIEQLK